MEEDRIRLLWFDVEKRYNTTRVIELLKGSLLWFDVEKRYNTTLDSVTMIVDRCGLM